MVEADALPDPLLDVGPLPFEAPEFDRIEPGQFLPAFEVALAASRADIAAIADDPAPATFANTIVALERAGATLARVRRIYWTLASAQSEPGIRAVEAEVSMRLARHATAIAHDPRLFGRIHAVWQARERLGLDEAQRRLLDAGHRGFVDGGALLDTAGKARFGAISERLSALSTRFGQNVLAATAEGSMLVTTAEGIGLPAAMLAATAREAASRGLDGHLITLDRGDVEAFLAFADRRDLRERLWHRFVSRGEGGDHDNRGIVAEIVALRREQAGLLGHPSFADYALADTMAATPDAAEALMMRVWSPALHQARREEAELQRLADCDAVTLAAWDWRYYAERQRRERFALDGEAIRAVLPLAGVRGAAFAVAGRLFGLGFLARPDIPGWHADVAVWEVADRDRRPIGLLYTDFLARPEKHGGAWMGALRVQEKLDGPVLPQVYIVTNFARGAPGGDTGLSVDEARTLFHEFGHAIHALLSDVTYPSQSGTAVARDFVEFPSKLMEHWIVAPEVLAALGVPGPLTEAIGRVDTVGQGFATVEFLASAIVDLAIHRQHGPIDPAAFARSLLDDIGMPSAIVPRHGLSHFTHIFDGGYASRYYSYLWSEVLDADAFEAFTASGDLFDSALAGRLVREILARGDTREPMTAFAAFRGRPPDEAALLRSRALPTEASRRRPMPDDNAKTATEEEEEYAAKASADDVEKASGGQPAGERSGPDSQAKAEAVERSSGGIRD